jgi:hypothetical protein
VLPTSSSFSPSITLQQTPTVENVLPKDDLGDAEGSKET